MFDGARLVQTCLNKRFWTFCFCCCSCRRCCLWTNSTEHIYVAKNRELDYIKIKCSTWKSNWNFYSTVLNRNRISDGVFPKHSGISGRRYCLSSWNLSLTTFGCCHNSLNLHHPWKLWYYLLFLKCNSRQCFYFHFQNLAIC